MVAMVAGRFFNAVTPSSRTEPGRLLLRRMLFRTPLEASSDCCSSSREVLSFSLATRFSFHNRIWDLPMMRTDNHYRHIHATRATSSGTHHFLCQFQGAI